MTDNDRFACYVNPNGHHFVVPLGGDYHPVNVRGYWQRDAVEVPADPREPPHVTTVRDDTQPGTPVAFDAAPEHVRDAAWATFYGSAQFDRFDICEAYAALESDYNVGGWLRERPSNARRRESCGVQLHRMKYRPSPLWEGYESLSDNALAIYHIARRRFGLRV